MSGNEEKLIYLFWPCLLATLRYHLVSVAISATSFSFHHDAILHFISCISHYLIADIFLVDDIDILVIWYGILFVRASLLPFLSFVHFTDVVRYLSFTFLISRCSRYFYVPFCYMKYHLFIHLPLSFILIQYSSMEVFLKPPLKWLYRDHFKCKSYASWRMREEAVQSLKPLSANRPQYWRNEKKLTHQ